MRRKVFNCKQIREVMLRVKGEKIYIIGFAKGRNWPLTLKAMHYANGWHEDEKRDTGIDYIEHPIIICRSLINLNNERIVTDAICAAALLHDVVESGKATLEEIRQLFGDEVAYLVDLLTKREGETREQYFKRLSVDPRAILIKGEDRIWNIDMIKLVLAGYPKALERFKRYIVETETHILPMLKEGRKKYEEYSDAFVSFRDHIRNVLTAAKAFVEEREKNIKQEQQIKKLKKALKAKRGK